MQTMSSQGVKNAHAMLPDRVKALISWVAQNKDVAVVLDANYNEVSHLSLSDMPWLVFMQGMPGSGKTSLAEHCQPLAAYISSNDQYLYTEMPCMMAGVVDGDLLHEEGDYTWTPQAAEIAKSLAVSKAEKLIEAEDTLIIDNTNLRPKGISQYLKSWNRHGRKHIIYFMRMVETSPGICFARCQHNVPWDKMEEFAATAKQIQEEEGHFPAVDTILETMRRDLMQDISIRLPPAIGGNTVLDFHPFLVIDDPTKLMVLQDTLNNFQSLTDSILLAKGNISSVHYVAGLMKHQFRVEEQLQLFPIREGRDANETGDWQLPVNLEGNGKTLHRNLLCVGFGADPGHLEAFQKPASPNLWFLPASAVLAQAPPTFNASAIQQSEWTVGGKAVAGFAGLTAAIGAAVGELDLAAPMAKLFQFVSADGSMVAKHHFIQPEVQLVGGDMAPNKEFHAEYHQEIWTFAWRQKHGTRWVEKYKFSVDAEGGARTTRVSIIPFNPSEKTFVEPTQQMQAEILQLFRQSHFPVMRGPRQA